MSVSGGEKKAAKQNKWENHFSYEKVKCIKITYG